MSDKADLASRARWQRWEMDSLQSLKLRRRASDHDPHHQAELAKRRAQAASEGRTEGLNKGYREGFEQGRTEGLAQGMQAGREQGRTEGRAQGHQEGFAKGLEQGLAEGKQQAQDQAARLDTLVHSCTQALESLEEDVGQSIIHLSVRIAEQVLRSHLRNHPNALLDLVQEIMQSRPDQNTMLHVRLHPEDLQLVETWLKQSPDQRGYRLVADEHITRGGCIAETALGSVDATLETRWQRIIAALGQTVPATDAP